MRSGQRIVGSEPTPPSEAEFMEGFNKAGEAAIAEMRAQAAIKRTQAQRWIQEAKALEMNAKRLEDCQRERPTAGRGARGRAAAEIVMRVVSDMYPDVMRLPAPESGRTSPAKHRVKVAVEADHGSVFVAKSTVFNNTWQRLMDGGRIAYADRPDEG